MKKIILITIISLAIFLRFYKLGTIPLSLYWDEASLGYNAYSILKTAKGEHGKFLPITNFAAFGDYKPPGYIYATVPSIAVFGLNEQAIRFPSALFGVLTVLLTYFLTKKLLKNEYVALFSSFYLAISSWHIQMSRAAFEANVALFFSVLGIYMFIKFALDNPRYLWISALSFIIAMYTFTGQRLFIPFILLILALQFRKEIFSNIKQVIFVGVISFVLFYPMLQFATGTIEGRLRFDEVSIFKNLQPIEDSISYRQKYNYSLWANIIYNRRIFYTKEYLKHYFDAFRPSFLFISGDNNPRLSIQSVGEIYIFNILFLVAGIYYLFSTKQKYRYLIIGWVLISPLGPATARETPHALRMIHILPSVQIISAFGLYYFFRTLKLNKYYKYILAAIITISLFYYLYSYYFEYPQNYSGQWQYGYKEAIQAAKKEFDTSDNVVISKHLGRPYIYFLLYLKYPPADYFQNAQITIDQFYFIHVNRFDKFIFTDYPSRENLTGKTLYIANVSQTPPDAVIIDKIYDPLGKEVFRISKKSK